LIYKIGVANIKVIITPNNLRIKESAYEDKNIKWLDQKYMRIKKE
jgi:hypothetical protein